MPADMSRTIVVKNHGFSPEYVPNRNVILLVRNPYDVFKAEFNRRAGGHVGHASENAFASPGGN